MEYISPFARRSIYTQVGINPEQCRNTVSTQENTKAIILRNRTRTAAEFSNSFGGFYDKIRLGVDFLFFNSLNVY